MNEHDHSPDAHNDGSGSRQHRPRLNLRAAIEKLLAENAAARAAKKSSARRCGHRPPRSLVRLASAPRLTITLRERHRLDGALPIAELLDQALEVIAGVRHRRNDHRLAGWLFQIGVRAVCEAVVECGYLPLPLAVGMETCWWKQSGCSGSRTLAPVRGKNTKHQAANLLRLSVRLDDPPACAGELPLPEVIDAALDVLSRGHHQPGNWRGERWFFLQALRAVCEAVLEAGELPLPLQVTLHHRERGWKAPARTRVRTSALRVVPCWPPGSGGFGVG